MRWGLLLWFKWKVLAMQFWKVGHPSLNKGCESLLKHNNSYDFLFWSNCFPFRAAVIKPDQHHICGVSKNSACQKPLTCSFNSGLEVNCRKGFSHLFLFQRIWLLVVSLLATYVFDSPKWLRNFLLHIFREGKHHHFSGWYSNFVYKHTKSWLSLSKVAYISHKWLVAPVFWGQRKSELITI